MADVSANTGREGCQCLIQILSAPQNANIYDEKYEYGASYGWRGCKPYDEDLPPFCDPHRKFELNDDQPLDFCTSEWCYVNKSACTTAGYKPSVYFEDGETYSYETCNSTDTFTKGYEDGAWKKLVHHTFAGAISVIVIMILVVVYTVVALNALRKRERVPRPWDLVALACRGALMGWDRAKEGAHIVLSSSSAARRSINGARSSADGLPYTPSGLSIASSAREERLAKKARRHGVMSVPGLPPGKGHPPGKEAPLPEKSERGLRGDALRWYGLAGKQRTGSEAEPTFAPPPHMGSTEALHRPSQESTFTAPAAIEHLEQRRSTAVGGGPGESTASGVEKSGSRR